MNNTAKKQAVRKQGASHSSDGSTVKILNDCAAERALAQKLFDNDVHAFLQEKEMLRHVINEEQVNTVVRWNDEPWDTFASEDNEYRCALESRKHELDQLLFRLKQITFFDEQELAEITTKLKKICENPIDSHNYYKRNPSGNLIQQAKALASKEAMRKNFIEIEKIDLKDLTLQGTRRCAKCGRMVAERKINDYEHQHHGFRCLACIEEAQAAEKRFAELKKQEQIQETYSKLCKQNRRWSRS